MKILGIDIETGASFDTPVEDNFTTEIGAVMWDTELGQPVQFYSALILDGPESCDEAIEYTGITNEMRQACGVPLNEAMLELLAMVQECDYLMAHNGERFDKIIIERDIKKVTSNYIPKVWIDSLIDVEQPKKYTNANLTYLKGAKEITYPGHRAMFDVCAMLEINLKVRCSDDVRSNELREKYDALMSEIVADNIERMTTSASSPLVTVRAIVSYHQRDLAKKEKFYWDGDRKMWLKEMREIKLESVTWPFRYAIIS